MLTVASLDEERSPPRDLLDVPSSFSRSLSSCFRCSHCDTSH
jgi:hypothetical protein